MRDVQSDFSCEIVLCIVYDKLNDDDDDVK